MTNLIKERGDSMTKRVVVTGMGTINSLGHRVEDTWEALKNGLSGVGPITLIETDDLLVKIACEVKNFIPGEHLEIKEARRIDRYQQFAKVAAQEALDQSGFDVGDEDPTRVGVVVSTAVGGMTTLDEGMEVLFNEGPRKLNPFFIPKFMPNGAASLIGIDIGAQGPSCSVASACSSGADSIGLGMQMIQTGVIDACIAGGSEATITRIGVSSFDRLGALSRRNEDYSMTPAPFDRDRDGLVMGEGAGILVLETLERAKARGAEILGEIAGHGATSDAFHITAPSEQGLGGAAAMRIAMDRAGLTAADVHYVNAHGTATQLNDTAETYAIKKALGDRAYQVPVSSTKSMTGHMMGATGALEAIICLLVIRDNIIPPTIHYSEADPECDLDYVPNEAREQRVASAISNAFGFGGHNGVLAFRAFSD